jgi:acyl dehydratase
MAAAVIDGLSSLKEWVGREIGVGEWMEITQERITKFAEVTEDRQWIHIDAERAKKESPYGTTIAHGFLTVSLLSRLVGGVVRIGGLRMAVNYGLNRVRFPAPVRAGAKIRARVVLAGLKELEGGSEAVFGVTVECEGGEKPCCVAEWVVRYYS